MVRKGSKSTTAVRNFDRRRKPPHCASVSAAEQPHPQKTHIRSDVIGS